MGTITIAFLPQANWLMGEANFCGPIQSSTYSSAYPASIRYEAAVTYAYDRSPEVIRAIFKMILNPLVIYSALILLIFVINLLLQRILGLETKVEKVERQVKGAINLWRDELRNNKALLSPSPKKAN